MTEHRKSISRKIGFTSTTSKDVLVAASKIIDKNANNLSVLISRKKISDLIKLDKIINDEKNILQLFSEGIGFDLRFYECLSLAYVCRYNEHHAKLGSDYILCVDVDDRFKGQTDKELFFSDGVMAHVINGEIKAFTPMQQVLAQNLLGDNNGKTIADILIEEANKKIKRRDSYNDISGLIISVIANDDPIDMNNIIKSIDTNAFLPTFLVVYGVAGNLKTATVMYLSGEITSYEELKRRSLIIEMPSLLVTS